MCTHYIHKWQCLFVFSPLRVATKMGGPIVLADALVESSRLSWGSIFSFVIVAYVATKVYVDVRSFQRRIATAFVSCFAFHVVLASLAFPCSACLTCRLWSVSYVVLVCVLFLSSAAGGRAGGRRPSPALRVVGARTPRAFPTSRSHKDTGQNKIHLKFLEPPAAKTATTMVNTEKKKSTKKIGKNKKIQGPVTFKRRYSAPRMALLADVEWGAESD